MGQARTSFVILGQSRSGTQLLRALLATHPGIHCDGELFHKNLEYTRFRALREILRLYPYPLLEHRMNISTAPAYGFNLMFYHVHFPKLVLRRLAQAGWTIIHLMREDLIEVALSFLKASRSNTWHRHAGDARPDYRVTITPDQLSAELLKRIRWRTLELDLLDNIRHVKVNYEDDLQDACHWQAACDRIFSALKLQRHHVGTSLLKTDARRSDEIIENYAELQAWLNSSRYPEQLQQVNSARRH